MGAVAARRGWTRHVGTAASSLNSKAPRGLTGGLALGKIKPLRPHRSFTGSRTIEAWQPDGARTESFWVRPCKGQVSPRPTHCPKCWWIGFARLLRGSQPRAVIPAQDQRERCWNCHRHLSDSPVGTRLLGRWSVGTATESQGDASGANCASVGSLQQNQGSVSLARSPAGPSEMAPRGRGALKVVALPRIRASISSNV